MCNGMCNGKCVYTQGSAMCNGECHGMCTATTTPPTCTGTLNCMGSAECHSNCQASASAHVNCPPPQAQVTITGDAALFGAFQAHLDDIGTAVNLTLALKNAVGNAAGKR